MEMDIILLMVVIMFLALEIYGIVLMLLIGNQLFPILQELQQLLELGDLGQDVVHMVMVSLL